MEWNEMREKIKKIKNEKYVIKNCSTGNYICDSKGEIKIFHNPDEAKMYIKIHRLTSMFELCTL